MNASANSSKNKTKFAALTEGDRVVTMDGGLATELESQGHDISGVLWSALLLQTNPQAIVSAHKAYLAAGAEIIVTASYQASRAGFHQLGISAEDADALILSSVALARQAIHEYQENTNDTRARLVAASIGPYGAVLMDGSEYTGDYGVPRAILRDFHEQRLALLDSSDADVLACETIPSIDEAMVLADLLADVQTPAWVSFSCRNANQISDGTPITKAAALFAEHPNVLALGVNCTAPQHVASLIKSIAKATPDKAILAYPNSGERYEATDNSWSGDASDVEFATAAESWVAAGASLVGGCCRVGPGHIAALAE